MPGEWMESEIWEQPAVMLSGVSSYPEQLRWIAHGAIEPAVILLVARGSSDHAALYVRYLVEVHLGIPAILAAPSVWTRYRQRPKYPAALVVGISQSGEAPDVTEVIAAMREDGHQTLAITNTVNSHITRAAEHTLLLDVGEERSIAATKTYTASLLALYELVRALGASLPAPNLPGVDWIEEARLEADRAVGAIVRCSPLFSIARGFSFATAHEASLKLMECALLPCKAYSSADFEHGPKALAGHGSAALVFGAEPPGLAAQGCEIVLAPKSSAPEEMAPIWDAIFAQWLALLAARARGLDPDRARHLKKVTRTR